MNMGMSFGMLYLSYHRVCLSIRSLQSTSVSLQLVYLVVCLADEHFQIIYFLKGFIMADDGWSSRLHIVGTREQLMLL